MGAAKNTDPVQQANETVHEFRKNQSDKMINCLSGRGNLCKENNEECKDVFVKEIHDFYHVSGCPAPIFFTNPVNREHKKSQDDWIIRVVWGVVNSVRKDFEFTKFSGKKQQNPKQILFHKKQKDKNFFLEKNC